MGNKAWDDRILEMCGRTGHFTFQDAKNYDEFKFPWTVGAYIDEDGDTVVSFTDAPPNIHLSAHGKDFAEAIVRLNDTYKAYQETGW
jgi:hypothetical protein